MLYFLKDIKSKVNKKYLEVRDYSYLALGNFLLSTKEPLTHSKLLNVFAEMEMRGLAPKGVTSIFNSITSQGVSSEEIHKILTKYLTVDFYVSVRKYMNSSLYGQYIPRLPSVKETYKVFSDLSPSGKERLERIRGYSEKSGKNHPIRPVRPRITIVEADRPESWFWAMEDDIPAADAQLELPF